MNKYISKFNQEKFSILFVSIITIWWSFNFSPFARSPYPYNIILSSIQSVFGVCCCIYMFSCADIFKKSFTLDFLNDFPLSDICKTIYKVSMFTVLNGVFFFMWYKNVYHMRSEHYIIYYVHVITIGVLFYKAVHRRK
jgi:hypothetical protein